MVEYGAAGQAFKVEGARKLRATLRSAGDDLSDLKDANRQAANIVAPVARGRVPQRSGKLAETIRPGATKTAAIVRAGNNRKAGVAYANPIHWGWFARGIKPALFLSLAAQESEPQWRAPYEKALQDALNKIEGTTP
ncbi:hypothetical protein [Leucobacter ruminantium]|uniref:HK97 gp10 family phage protein n=1 Tax=Leucobacter ruminantium TaxID=1289170 RepID=A0A939RZW9_9MICO|nr:hypothetical protein [Leucobacter ruminantium]MBO1805899.1 hypothetical protein [Leucobacter ruminantium]